MATAILYPRSTTIFHFLYNTFSSLLSSLGPATDHIVQLLASPFSANLLLPRFLDSPAYTGTRLIEPSVYTIPILSSLPVLSSGNLSMSTLPPSLASPPPEPPLFHQRFLESACQVATDVVIYVAKPPGLLFAEEYAHLLKLVVSFMMFLCLIEAFFILVGQESVTGCLIDAAAWAWITVKTGFFDGLDTLPEPPRSLHFKARVVGSDQAMNIVYIVERVNHTPTTALPSKASQSDQQSVTSFSPSLSSDFASNRVINDSDALPDTPGTFSTCSMNRSGILTGDDETEDLGTSASQGLKPDSRPDVFTLRATTDVDSKEFICAVDPNLLAPPSTPQPSSDVSLHHNALSATLDTADFPGCDDGEVPYNCQTMQTLCMPSRCSFRIGHIVPSVRGEHNIIRGFLNNTGTCPITVDQAPPRQSHYFPAMPLPPSRRTPFPQRLLGSTEVGSLPPVVLSHTIDISLVRYIHPHDSEWDSFETSYRAGMLPGYIVIPSRRRSVRPNGAIIPIDSPMAILRQRACYIPRHFSLPTICNNALSIQQRCIQRPEVYYSTPIATNMNAGSVHFTTPPARLSSPSEWLAPTVHHGVQQARVRASIAAANILANDRRKAMYSNTAVPFESPSLLFYSVPTGGIPGPGIAHATTALNARGSIFSQWISNTVYDVNRFLWPSVSGNQLAGVPADVIAHERWSQADSLDDQEGVISQFSALTPVACTVSGEEAGLASNAALNLSAADLGAFSGKRGE